MRVFRVGKTEKDPVGRRRRSKVLRGDPAPRKWAGADMGVSGALNLSDSGGFCADGPPKFSSIKTWILAILTWH